MSAPRAYDAVIVGAGVIGLSVAWRSAQRGLHVCVIDRDLPGTGASRVAAGMLAPVTEAEFGELELLKLNLLAAERYGEFVAELEAEADRSVGYRVCGSVTVALDRDEAAELRRLHEFKLGLGLATEWLRPSALRALEPGLAATCTAGALATGEAQVDPRRLTGALVVAAERAGVTIVSGAEVIASSMSDGRMVGVGCADGRELRGAAVVLATGAWSGASGWLPSAAEPPPVRPVKGQALVLGPRGGSSRADAGPRGADGFYGALCERIVRTPSVYVVPRADGRVVVGATVEEMGFDTTVTAGGVYELLREAYRVLPEIAEFALLESLAGLRPGTPDNRPLIGPSGVDGLLLATGHYRNGILLSDLTGEAVARLLTGEDPQPEVMAACFPGRGLSPGASYQARRARTNGWA